MKKKIFLPAVLIASISLSFGGEAIKAKGSLRYRHETILVEDQHSRNRHRVQAKAGLTAKVNKNISGAIELASGGLTARSANTTLDGGFTKKTVAINQAYISFICTMGLGLSLKAGKFKNPFEKVGKSELIWDSDNVPEGAALGWSKDFSGIAPFINAVFFWVNEQSKSTDDIYLISGQGGIKAPFSGGAYHISAGAGYHYYDNVQGSGTLDPVDGGFHGNATNGAGTAYANHFSLLEAFGEFGAKLGELPVALFGHFVTNLEADNDNVAWLAGINLGKVKKPGSFNFRCYYRFQERESVLGLFGDSDFGGGSTDTKGFEANLGAGLMENVSGSITWFLNERGIDNPTGYNRGQFDVKVKF